MWMKHVLDGSSGFVYRHFCLAHEVTVVKFTSVTTTTALSLCFLHLLPGLQGPPSPPQVRTLPLLWGFPSLNLSWGRFLSLTQRTSSVAQMVKHLPTMRETRVRSLGREDPLEKEMATQYPLEKEMATHSSILEKEMAIHSSILAWKISWTEEPGWLLSMGSQRWGRKELDRTEQLHYLPSVLQHLMHHSTNSTNVTLCPYL